MKSSEKQPLLIRAVSIIDGVRDHVLYHQNILIENGRISRIWQGDITESGILIIPGENKFAIPGLIDSHVHLFPGCYNDFLLHGTTGVRDMASVSDWTIEQRQRIEGGEVIGLHIYTHGELIDGLTSRRKDSRYTICVSNEKEISIIIDQLAQKGVDAIKLYSELSFPVFSKGINSAHELGLTVSAHVGHSRRVTVKQAVEAGVDAIEHTATFLPDMFPSGVFSETIRDVNTVKNQLRGYITWSKVNLRDPIVTKLVSLLVERQVYHTPTLINIANLIEGDCSISELEIQLIHRMPEEITSRWKMQTPSIYEDWNNAEREIARSGFEVMKQLVSLFYKSGVRLGVGSDAPNPWTIPGNALIREMELLVECGIPPMRVIQLATKDAAAALGNRFRNTGTITEGNTADLIILDDNPVVNISNCRKIAHIIRQGVLINS